MLVLSLKPLKKLTGTDGQAGRQTGTQTDGQDHALTNKVTHKQVHKVTSSLLKLLLAAKMKRHTHTDLVTSSLLELLIAAKNLIFLVSRAPASKFACFEHNCHIIGT